MNLKFLSTQMGTSVAMIDKHYGHVELSEIGGEIAKKSVGNRRPNAPPLSRANATLAGRSIRYAEPGPLDNEHRRPEPILLAPNPRQSITGARGDGTPHAAHAPSQPDAGYHSRVG